MSETIHTLRFVRPLKVSKRLLYNIYYIQLIIGKVAFYTVPTYNFSRFISEK